MIHTVRELKCDIDRRTALGFLGAGSGDTAVLDECIALVTPVLRPAACYGRFPVGESGGALDLGFTRTESESLKRFLAGCGGVIVFACTVGAEVDRLIAKYERISPAHAAGLQAAGAAAVESACDALCGMLAQGCGARPARFSCGYGDAPLDLQRDIFAALDVTKNIGIALSDSCFMTPTKSVTAFVGADR